MAKVVASSNQANYSSEHRSAILSQMPQTEPFLFIDSIDELSDEHIVSRYHFHGAEWFFKGHFKNDPVTPGVILIEAMAQAGLVALGLHLVAKRPVKQEMRTLFSDCTVEFLHIVRPGDSIQVNAECLRWRKNKLRSQVEVTLLDGKRVAVGSMSGLAVLV